MPPRSKSTGLVLKPKSLQQESGHDQEDPTSNYPKTEQERKSSSGKAHKSKMSQDSVEKKYDELKSSVNKLFDDSHHLYEGEHEIDKDKIVTSIRNAQERINDLSHNILPPIENSLTVKTNNLKNLRKRDREFDELTKRLQHGKGQNNKLNEFCSAQIDELKRDLGKLVPQGQASSSKA